MLHTAIAHDGPAALRYPRGAAEGVGDSAPGRGDPDRHRRAARERRAGGAAGLRLRRHRRPDAAEILAGHDLKPTVADARFAKPIDTELLERLALGHDLIVTIEEGVLPGGFGSAALEHLEDAFSDRPEERARLLRIGLPDRFVDPRQAGAAAQGGRPDRALGRRAGPRRAPLRGARVATEDRGACTKALNRLACASLLKAGKQFRWVNEVFLGLLQGEEACISVYAVPKGIGPLPAAGSAGRGSLWGRRGGYRIGGGVPSALAASSGSQPQTRQACWKTERENSSARAWGSSAATTSSQSRMNSPEVGVPSAAAGRAWRLEPLGRGVRVGVEGGLRVFRVARPPADRDLLGVHRVAGDEVLGGRLGRRPREEADGEVERAPPGIDRGRSPAVGRPERRQDLRRPGSRRRSRRRPARGRRSRARSSSSSGAVHGTSCGVGSISTAADEARDRLEQIAGDLADRAIRGQGDRRRAAVAVLDDAPGGCGGRARRRTTPDPSGAGSGSVSQPRAVRRSAA